MNSPAVTDPEGTVITPASQNDPVLVPITELRRDMAKYFAMASKGRVVIITKEGIPYLQLMPVRYTFHQTDVLEQTIPPSSAE
jgi:prevent-host-death family protein